MRIVNHWLTPDATSEKIRISKTKNAGDLIDPDYVVIHYTATDTAASAVDWFMNTSNNPDRIAAHIVLDYDGTITQLVPFNRKANHAGTSAWDGVDFFNSHAIGIEIVNPGFVEKLPTAVLEDQWQKMCSRAILPQTATGSSRPIINICSGQAKKINTGLCIPKHNWRLCINSASCFLKLTSR